ncbi:CAP domain-containing protein [Aeromicrobium choanae]|uniref:Cysteine-rich secretory protein family protein n=1 Tax=Aeromicrobium choanae TaxID=1736691 RepID=A0A1T4YRE3_9ACTN|nr:CAP domain-containing protein [Aeromicrobium choanae]SKB04306.1 Cysteine-rich secretory protein family protein [Aeromicrobium choanae]
MRHTIALLLTASALVVASAPAGAAATVPTKVAGFTAKSQTAAPGASVRFSVKVTAKGRASARRVVSLQRHVGGRWVRADRARTNAYGRVVLRHRVGTKAGVATKLRVRVAAKGRLRAVNSSVKKVTVRAPWTPDARSKEILSLVNEARSTARSCGSEPFAARGPVRLESRLSSAAQRHALDMATHDFFSHTGSNGSDLSDRVDAQGYDWSRLGENIAAGQQSPKQVVGAWLASPGHCRNIMGPFTELGVGYATGDTRYGTYWVQDFGTPR